MTEKNEESKELARYTLDDGEEVTLTAYDVKQYIADNPNVTMKEMMMFAQVCKAHRINPLTREAYLVKYGTFPATVIVGKGYWMRKASENADYDGMEAGVTVAIPDKFDANGRPTHSRIERREGSLCGSSERIVGGWARVHRKSRQHPSFDEVAFSEYSTGKSMWAKMPATMIRKVAVAHALREAFPEEFNGLYDSAEIAPPPQTAVQPAPAPQQVETVQASQQAQDVAAVVQDAIPGADVVEVIE